MKKKILFLTCVVAGIGHSMEEVAAPPMSSQHFAVPEEVNADVLQRVLAALGTTPNGKGTTVGPAQTLAVLEALSGEPRELLGPRAEAEAFNPWTEMFKFLKSKGYSVSLAEFPGEAYNDTKGKNLIGYLQKIGALGELTADFRGSFINGVNKGNIGTLKEMIKKDEDSLY